MDDDLRVRIIADESLAQVADVVAAVNAAVEKVRDDGDVASYAKLLVGGCAQAFRDRRHEIGLIDREGNNLGIRRVAADQRDVRPVKGRHHPWRFAAMRADDLA